MESNKRVHNSDDEETGGNKRQRTSGSATSSPLRRSKRSAAAATTSPPESPKHRRYGSNDTSGNEQTKYIRALAPQQPMCLAVAAARGIVQSNRTNVSSSSSAAAAEEVVPPPPLPRLDWTSHNVVAVFDAGCLLNLRLIVERVQNTEYDPTKFSSVICRATDPKATALIFASGKVVVTGARNCEEALKAARKFAKLLRKVGHANAQFKQFRYHNMVAVAKTNVKVRLRLLSETHAMFCTYEPEQFSGVVYRMFSPQAVLMIFASGKIVVMGVKSPADIELALQQIHPVILQHRREEIELIQY